ncbi:hypothetical protein [Poseidonibacter ostreae]|uniref:CobQ/CobB/MinD/ParA nucleotide binding domain-containing protein n=1 Tax=Poseidonibacter ostreae TaxID=2654171 RepID=A0A6L4WWI7_9BACT|nr:hypothetical protein [Poseidonibacter ostreae]KAB7889577.1 hypothetical protein GBG19_05840 [Poseidonibacter ostreae]
MSYAVWNYKGGVGKTTLSIQLAKIFEYEYFTNDSAGAQDIVKDGTGFCANENDKEFPFEREVIYDFGGYKDPRMIDILEKCDKVIVPLQKSFLDIKTTLQTLIEISEFNSNVIVIVNRFSGAVKKREEIFNDIQEYLLQELEKAGAEFDSIEFMTIRDSELLADCQFDGDSIYDRINSQKNKGFYKSIYKNLVSDIDKLVELLEV